MLNEKHIQLDLLPGARTVYVPVFKSGQIQGVKVCYNKASTSSETITVSNGGSAVNVMTFGSADASGAVIEGVTSNTYSGETFDSDHPIKIVASAGTSLNSGVAILTINYDEFQRVSKRGS